MKWKEHAPAKNALLSAINDESGKIKEAKSRILTNLLERSPMKSLSVTLTLNSRQ